MSIEIFDFLWFYFFKTCLFGFRLDTGKLPFSIVVKLFPLYKIDNFWYDVKLDCQNGRMNVVKNLLIPYICDILYIKEI